MKKYKMSKYTYSCSCDNNVLLINTLSRKLMFSEDGDKVNEIMKEVRGQGDVETESLIFQALKSKGFIIEDAVDENVIAKKKYWDYVYDNRLGITLMPTEQCNCRCPYCYENFTNPKMSDETIENLMLFLKKNLVSYTGLNISWFGGEPLLAMDVIEKISKEVIDICHMRKIIYDSSITTNGVLLTSDVFKKLLKCKVNRFQITLDGPKDIHDKTRVLRNGKETFDTIVSNLIAIKNIKTSTIKINVRINVTKETLEKLPEFVDFLYDIFGEDKRFSFYFRPIGDWNNNIEIESLKSSLLPSLNSLYDILLECPQKLNYGILYQMIINSMCYANKRNHFVLGSDGAIYKCTVYFDREENKVGKLVSNGKILWNEERLAKWIHNDFSSLACEGCLMEATCHGKGCPAKELIFGKKSGCGYEMENIETILKLLFQSNGIHQLFEDLIGE